MPLSWGATFDPELVERMSRRIGDDMRSVGVHQGLAPVLDVVRDARWGRVEETIGEDPYLVGTIGTAYVRGLESAGVVATLKHFVGYSASRAGRNLAPVSIGAAGARRRAAAAVRDGDARRRGAQSVMNAYTDLDGVPSAADRDLLTGLLRETWGFEGTVVADYFAVAFLKLLHGVAGDLGRGGRGRARGGHRRRAAHGEGVRRAAAAGGRRRARRRGARRHARCGACSRQKAELGLLDADWSPVPPALDGADLDSADALRGTVDLDSAENRALAARARRAGDRAAAQRRHAAARRTGDASR